MNADYPEQNWEHEQELQPSNTLNFDSNQDQEQNENESHENYEQNSQNPRKKTKKNRKKRGRTRPQPREVPQDQNQETIDQEEQLQDDDLEQQTREQRQRRRLLMSWDTSLRNGLSRSNNRSGRHWFFILYCLFNIMGLLLVIKGKMKWGDYVIMIILFSFLYVVGRKLIRLIRESRYYGHDVNSVRNSVRRQNSTISRSRYQRDLLLDSLNLRRSRQQQTRLQDLYNGLQIVRLAQANQLNQQQQLQQQQNQNNQENENEPQQQQNNNNDNNNDIEAQNPQIPQLQLQVQQQQQQGNQNQMTLDFLRVFLQGMQMNQRFDQLLINLQGMRPQEQNNGLNQEQIDNLPQHIAGKEDVGALQQCTICLVDFEEGDKVRTLPCVHNFHAQCIDEWLQRQNHCPNCRQDI